MDANENETTKTGTVFHTGKPTKIIVEVRPRHILATVDGRSVIDWHGDLTRLSPGGEIEPRATSIGSWTNKTGGRVWSFSKIVLSSIPETVTAVGIPPTIAAPIAINIPPAGFESIFNGTDFTNWSERKPEHWSVANGILRYDGKGANAKNLVSAKAYGDFELLVDWKIEPGGDSGIYLRGKPQVQIKDDATGSGGLYNNKTNPKGPRIRADKPAGEWNTFRIVMRGERVTVTLNGQLVVDNVVMENYPSYVGSIPSRGPIELQKHTGAAEFRNVFVRELTSTPDASRAVGVVKPEGKPAVFIEKAAVPKDAVYFEDHAYKFFAEVLTWHRAKQRCEEMGGHLAVISSAKEDRYIAQMAKKKIKSPNKMDGFWLGATDEVKEGNWKWIDGSELEYTNWGDGQPNNKGGQEHYLLYWLHGEKWSDQPDKSEQHKAFFICEWDTDSRTSKSE